MPENIRLTAFRYTSSLRRSKRFQTGTSTSDIKNLVVDDQPGEKVPPSCDNLGLSTADVITEDHAAKPGSQEPQQAPKPPPADAVYMRRHATLIHCVCLILGATIGPNVFLSPSVFVANSASIWSTIAVIVVCGALCTVAALCYADLITAFKESGGELIFFYRPLSDRAAYIQVWMAMIIGRTGGAAVMAVGFASLLILPFYPSCLGTPKGLIRVVAAMTLLALFFVNCASVKWALRLQVIFTAVKLVGLLFIILGAVVTLCQGNTETLQQSVNYRANFEFSKFAMEVFSIVNLFFGWVVIAFVAEDIVNINWTVPVAMLISLPLITVIYVGVNLAFLTVLTQEEIMNHPAVLMVFVSRIVGDRWWWFMPVIVAISTLSAFNGLVMGSGRLLMVFSRLHCGPEIWSMLHVKSNMPIAAFLTFIPISLVMIHIDALTMILNDLASFGWISTALSCLVLLLMKKKVPDVERPYQVPKMFPITFLIFTLILIGYAIYLSPIAVCITTVVAMSFFPIKKLVDKLFEKKPILLRQGGKMTLFLQKLLQVVHQEYQNY